MRRHPLAARRRGSPIPTAPTGVTILCLAMLLVPTDALSQGFKRLGSFDNVVSRTGEHCRGYSLELWQSGTEVIGLLDVHGGGLCGDPPCSLLQGVSFDPATGRLLFSAFNGASSFKFEGRLVRNAIVGTINGQAVRLTRTEFPDDWGPDQSMPVWCAFWAGVPRCTGVPELCSLKGISK